MAAHFSMSIQDLTWGIKWPYMIRVMADQPKASKADSKQDSMQKLRDKVNQIKAG